MPNIFDRAAKHRAELLARDRDAANLLVQAYGTAWSSTRHELDQLLARWEAAVAAGEEVSPSWLYRQERYQATLAELERGMREFVDVADTTIRDEQAEAVAAAQDHAHEHVAADLADAAGPTGVPGTFVRMPKDALDHLVGTLADGSPLHRLLAGLPGEAGEVFAQALVAGVAKGENPRRIAAQVRDAMGGNLNRALTIARTEVLRSYRESTRLGLEANADVVNGWTWLCATDWRSCAACWAMHGTQHPYTERLDGHPNCRCTMVPLTRSWQDLGAAADTADTRPTIDQGPDLFDDLPEHEQVAILGKAKLEAYQRGDIGLRDLVGRRDSADWGTMRYERSLTDVLRNGPGDPLERVGPIVIGATPMPADLARAVATTRRRGDLIDAAERHGLDVDELEQAMAAVKDLRAAVKLDATAARDEALAWLERNAEGGALAKPPRSVRRVSTGGRERQVREGAQGSWDWLEQLHPDELRRLHRGDGGIIQWFGGSSTAPDQLAQMLSFRFGDLDIDEAIALWLHQTRVVDAAAALARGRLPSMTGYGNLNLEDLVPNLAADGYDVTKLLGVDDLDAALHIADATRRQAAEYAARALPDPRLGPAPWRMSPYSFEEELRELEYDLQLPGGATPARLERLRELVPDDLDDPLEPLPYAQLHQAIVGLARVAGLL